MKVWNERKTRFMFFNDTVYEKEKSVTKAKITNYKRKNLKLNKIYEK